ncbi:MAG: FHA domain-containing protein [Methanomicrobiales archaeon]|nr:FHA domain-containing protein [Methanomicrobiales archaeon]
MERTERKGEKTLAVDYDADFLEDLSEYLEVLGHPQRLKILRAIEEEPKDIRTIAEETDATYENTKKHLYRLLGTGLVRKEAGFGQPTSRGILPVWKFSLMPGAMERILRNLGIFSAVRSAISDAAVRRRMEDLRDEIGRTLASSRAALVVVSGPQDGLVFPLAGDRIRIGRGEPGQTPSDTDLALAPAYASVTRISRPHAVIFREGGRWFIEDRGSSGGTLLNGRALLPEQAVPIRNGDVAELGRGPHTALIVLVDLPGEG